jgi:hypothetical protein
LLEKTGNSEFVVYLDESTNKVMLRRPGGAITEYDGRFGDITNGVFPEV